MQTFTDQIIDYLERHDLNTMPIRVRQYLWLRATSAQSPDVARYYRVAYQFFVSLGN